MIKITEDQMIKATEDQMIKVKEDLMINLNLFLRMAIITKITKMIDIIYPDNDKIWIGGIILNQKKIGLHSYLILKGF